MSKLMEVRVTEPAKNAGFKRPPALDGLYDHPDRFRYSMWWLNDDGSLTMVGSEGRFMPDEQGSFDYCGNPAQVMREVFPDRYMEADRFGEITEI